MNQNPLPPGLFFHSFTKTPMTATPKFTKNTLTHAESYRLTVWVKDNLDALTGLTQAQIAERAQQETGIIVKASNIAKVAETLEIKLGVWNEARTKAQQPKDDAIALALCLSELYDCLRFTKPEALKAILNGRPA